MKKKFFLILILNAMLIWGLLFLGPISINFKTAFYDEMLSKLLIDVRLPRLIIAIFAGGGLSVCGLVLQTWFKNHLADPFLLGVHSGSSLGVVVYLLGLQFAFNKMLLPQSFGPVLSGIIGAFAVLIIILFISRKFSGPIYIIIFGVVISFFITGLINLALSFSTTTELRHFFLWSLGSFDRIGLLESIIVGVIVFISSLILFLNSQALNLCLLGNNYALEAGLDNNNLNKIIIPAVGIISGLISVFCGPIIFIGLMAPHITRMYLRTSNHFLLIPGSFLVGAGLCQTVCFLSNGYLFSLSVPINALLGLLGTPFVLFLIMKTNSKNHQGSYA